MASEITEEKAPAISVLVPCYNVERYVEECLASIERQMFEDFEAILINDGSTDGTLGILQAFARRDARFRIIDKANSGYGASMNKGLDAARGEYIAILESDDFMEPDTLGRLHAAARDAEADAVKANFFFHWSDPEPRDEKNPLIGDDAPAVTNPHDFHPLFWYMPSIWSAIYRRDFLEENGIRFLETPGASYQDLAFTFKVWACARRVALVKDAFVHYRQDNEASSIHSPGKVFCVCDEFAEMERFLAEHPDMADLKPVEVRLKFDSYIWNYWRLDKDLRAQFYPRLVEDFKREQEAGTIDYGMFLPWREADLRQILADPDDYERWANATGGELGKMQSLLRYLRVGGPSLLMKRLRFKG